jgi:hypothetical protein
MFELLVAFVTTTNGGPESTVCPSNSLSERLSVRRAFPPARPCKIPLALLLARYCQFSILAALSHLKFTHPSPSLVLSTCTAIIFHRQIQSNPPLSALFFDLYVIHSLHITMVFPTAILLAVISLYHTRSSVEAFTLTRTAAPSILAVSFPYTGLFMSEESGGAGSEMSTEQAAQDTTAVGEDVAGGATDILNSPAFLKRKLEVLKSDIEKIQADLEAALERAEIAKEEWGPQLEDLQREVSGVKCAMGFRMATTTLYLAQHTA